jgi:hypothetical protein
MTADDTGAGGRAERAEGGERDEDESSGGSRTRPIAWLGLAAAVLPVVSGLLGLAGGRGNRAQRDERRDPRACSSSRHIGGGEDGPRGGGGEDATGQRHCHYGPAAQRRRADLHPSCRYRHDLTRSRPLDRHEPGFRRSHLDFWASALVEANKLDGSWESRLISVRGNGSAGESFTIYAVLVSENAIEYLQSAGASLWNLLGDADEEEFVASDLPPHDHTPVGVEVVRSATTCR